MTDYAAAIACNGPYLSRRRNWSSNGGRDGVDVDLGGVNLGGDRGLLLHRAVARNMASLPTAVAGLASSAQGTSVRCWAVLGDVSELAAGIALHGLGLAIPSKVVGTTALVARGRTRAAGVPTAAVAKATPANRASATEPDSARVGAVALQRVRNVANQRTVLVTTYSQMTLLVAVVAAAGAGTAQTKRWAVSLYMAQALTVVALLRLGGARKRALVRLVTWLLTCTLLSVTSIREIGAYKTTNSCSRGVQLRSKLQHSGQRCHICSMHDVRETFRQYIRPTDL